MVLSFSGFGGVIVSLLIVGGFDGVSVLKE